MANEFSYFDTPFTYIKPVRYFKANDPYYYEIDNIPIKQLEESSNFLKDQVDGLLNFKDNLNIEIDRKGFSELRPYATGNDRKVRVKPGKYTARINNAYDITPLQTVEQIAGFSVTGDPSERLGGNYKVWKTDTVNGDVVKASLDEFQQELLGAAFMMNGLYERTFVYPIGDLNGIDNPANPFKFLNVSTLGYGDYGRGLPFTNTYQFAPYPNYQGNQPGFNIMSSRKESRMAIRGEVYKNQGRVESSFIKRWRGAIRTSVVDIPEELEIVIPDYDPNDFFYFDSNGVRQPLASTQRIDLLFIYTKAIDESSTTINKFVNGIPTNITRAELGIVKGAGVGLSRELASNNEEFKDLVDIQSLDGTPLMLAHPGDENGSDVGFSTSAGFIKGSFPSPDDLMNLAPVLSENLETNAFPLIGQSILPIAYIRVQTDGGPVTDLITGEDIIDIRPFFRTTELAYNERAGIAAATPQVSIANPVVTETYLDQVRGELYTSLNNKIEGIQGSVGGSVGGSEAGHARVVGYGNVLGGFGYGPEGALALQFKGNVGGGLENAAINNTLYSELEGELGLAAGSVSLNPDWDDSHWKSTGDFLGTQPNDWINVAHGAFVNAGNTAGPNNRPAGTFGLRAGGTTGNNAQELPANRVRSWRGTSHANKNGMMYYVSKRININRTSVSWMEDYVVNAEFLNCIPLMGRTTGGQSEGIWIDKFKDYFIINVAWVGPDWRRIEAEESPNLAWQQGNPNNRSYIGTNQLQWGGTSEGSETYNFGSPPGTALKPWSNRNETAWFAGFALPQLNVNGAGVLTTYTPTKQGPETFNQGLNGGYTENNNVISNGSGGSSQFTKPEYLSPLTPILYPSVSFTITGFGNQFKTNSSGPQGNKMKSRDPIIDLL